MTFLHSVIFSCLFYRVQQRGRCFYLSSVAFHKVPFSFDKPVFQRLSIVQPSDHPRYMQHNGLPQSTPSPDDIPELKCETEMAIQSRLLEHSTSNLKRYSCAADLSGQMRFHQLHNNTTVITRHHFRRYIVKIDAHKDLCRCSFFSNHSYLQRSSKPHWQQSAQSSSSESGFSNCLGAQSSFR